MRAVLVLALTLAIVSGASADEAALDDLANFGASASAYAAEEPTRIASDLLARRQYVDAAIQVWPEACLARVTLDGDLNLNPFSYESNYDWSTGTGSAEFRGPGSKDVSCAALSGADASPEGRTIRVRAHVAIGSAGCELAIDLDDPAGTSHFEGCDVGDIGYASTRGDEAFAADLLAFQTLLPALGGSYAAKLLTSLLVDLGAKSVRLPVEVAAAAPATDALRGATGLFVGETQNSDDAARLDAEASSDPGVPGDPSTARPIEGAAVTAATFANEARAGSDGTATLRELAHGERLETQTSSVVPNNDKGPAGGSSSRLISPETGRSGLSSAEGPIAPARVRTTPSSDDVAPSASTSLTAAAASAAGPLTLVVLALALGALALAALLSRRSAARALDHPQRVRLLDAIRGSPGATNQDLARALGLYPNAIRHHLRYLTEAGIVRSVERGRSLHFFDASQIAPTAAPAMAELRIDTARRLVALVRERPGIGRKETARALGIAPSLVRYHARQLVAAGLLREEGRESGVALYVP